VTPVETRTPGTTSRDDVYRVTLAIEGDRDMTWVVVDDPIPGGATHVGTGLGRDSQILAAGAKPVAGPTPVFVERAFDGFRAYYDFVPAGRFTVEYTVRPSQAGTFALPPTRVEALYAPDIYGEIPNASVTVVP
jgi:uncharacterized protein YfaS (alpha-2-macroglobulin family)